MTSRTKSILIVSIVTISVIFLGLFGTYLANGKDWKAVINVVTLPQCIIAYLTLAGFGLCALIHFVFRRKQ